MTPPQRSNYGWSLGFVSGSLVYGRRFRILCVIDDFSCECLAMLADNSISGVRIARAKVKVSGGRDGIASVEIGIRL
jgi:putative transposase